MHTTCLVATYCHSLPSTTSAFSSLFHLIDFPEIIWMLWQTKLTTNMAFCLAPGAWNGLNTTRIDCTSTVRHRSCVCHLAVVSNTYLAQPRGVQLNPLNPLNSAPGCRKVHFHLRPKFCNAEIFLVYSILNSFLWSDVHMCSPCIVGRVIEFNSQLRNCEHQTLRVFFRVLARKLADNVQLSSVDY